MFVLNVRSKHCTSYGLKMRAEWVFASKKLRISSFTGSKDIHALEYSKPAQYWKAFVVQETRMLYSKGQHSYIQF